MKTLKAEKLFLLLYLHCLATELLYFYGLTVGKVIFMAVVEAWTFSFSKNIFFHQHHNFCILQYNKKSKSYISSCLKTSSRWEIQGGLPSLN